MKNCVIMKRDELKYRLIWGGLRALTRLPLGALYLLSDFAAFVLGRLLHYRAKVIRGNLRLAFPEKSDMELRRIEKAYYRHLCDVFVEAAKLANVSDSEMERRVKIEGIELVNEAIDRGKSVVLLLGHFGNWEWVTAAAREMHPGAVMCEIYHPLSDTAMDRVMLGLRSRFGTENIPMARTVRRLMEIGREGGHFVCGFISDQRPFTDDLKHWTDFLGVDTPYVNGGEMIGAKLGAEFLYVEMMPLKRGYYALRFKKLEPAQDGEENPYTRAYLHELERSIRQSPPDWLWSHNRWVDERSFRKRE